VPVLSEHAERFRLVWQRCTVLREQHADGEIGWIRRQASGARGNAA
jgi:hypothetical protein